MSLISEKSFLPQRVGGGSSLPLTPVERGVLRVARLLESGDDAGAIRRLIRRCRVIPISFPDPCPNMLVEGTDQAATMTPDSESHIWRRAKRRVILLPAPA